MLSTSAPNWSLTRSLNSKSLCTPRLTPHVPGPHSRLRLATWALLKTSEPTVGGANASGFQIWSPFFCLKLPITSGRYEGSALKSPTASSDVTPMFPGRTGASDDVQSSQVQNGVKPVPVLANMLNVVCQPPTTRSATRDMLAPNVRCLPNGRS